MNRTLTALLVLVAAISLPCTPTLGQTTTADAFIADGGAGEEPFIRLDAGIADNLNAWMWARDDGRLEFAVDSHRFMTAYPDVPDDAATIDAFGLGLGTTLPEEVLHVYSDGLGFDRARILIEDAHNSTSLRTLLKMENNGGSRIQMVNTDNGRKWFVAMENNGHFSIRMVGDDGPELLLKRNGAVEISRPARRTFALARNGNLEIAGTLTQSSDRNQKENIVPVDRREILEQVAKLPISTWNFRFDDATLRHMGPMAQDFHAAFELGANETTIAPIDAIGVTLAAVQALHHEADAKDDRIAELEAELEQQRTETDELKERMKKLEALLTESP